MIDTYGCTAIINAGTAGGMDEKLQIFDIVISTETPIMMWPRIY